MTHVEHSEWMFEHSLTHHVDGSIDPQAESWAPTNYSTQTASHASALTTLWHQDDLVSGGSLSAQGSSSSVAANSTSGTTGSGKVVSPTVTIADNTLTVDAGGSVSLPISVTPANGHTSVTITGLTSYELVTDSLDHKIFTPGSDGSITLSAAEVNSGLSLASSYTGTDHPVNTLTVTAGEKIGGHTVTSTAQTITVTDPPATSTSSGSSTSSNGASGTNTGTGATGTRSSNTLTLQVSGDQYDGDPQIEVFVDGQQVGGVYTVTADHTSGQTQTITIAGNFDPTEAHQVQVKFINDAWDGTSWWSDGSGPDGHDRNVYVSSISLNGETLTGSQGTNNAFQGSDPTGHANEAVMDVNGTLSFNVPVDPPATTQTGSSTSGSGSSTNTTGAGTTGTSSSNALTLQVSGDQYNGDPQIEVFVDGKQVGGTYTVTADHTSGQTQTITIAGNFDPTVAHQVQIKFINDAWDGTSWWSDGSGPDGHDRNVYVSSISLNGETLTGSQGTNNAFQGSDPTGHANEAVMDVNGTLGFNVPADPPATTQTGSSTTGTSASTGATTGSGDTTTGSGTTGTSGSTGATTGSGSTTTGSGTTGTSGSTGATTGSGSTTTGSGTTGTSGSTGATTDSGSTTTGSGTTGTSGSTGATTDSGSTTTGSGSTTGTSGSTGAATGSGSTADPPSTTTSSGGTTGTSGSTGAATGSGPAFYVAPDGNNSWAGDLAAPNAAGTDGPFATLARAQQAMEASSIKTTYVEGGTYHLSSSLVLTSADNGESFEYYPGSGVDTAILDGGSTNGTNGVQIGIDIEGGNNITINGLQLQHFAWLGIGVHGGAAFYATFTSPTGQAYGNTMINNSIHDIYGSAATDGFGGGIGICGQVANTTIDNNVIYNVDAFGIAAHAGYLSDNDTIQNLSIQNNVLYNTGLTRGAAATGATNSYQLGDFGAIYVQDDTGPQSGGAFGSGSTGVLIENNYVRDFGTTNDKGIYLDDGMSNATVTGNIVTGAGNYAVDIHSGQNNNVYGNIFDLQSNEDVLQYQNSESTVMAGNSFTGNIIIGNFAGAGSTGDVYFLNYSPGTTDYPTVQDNVYWNYYSGGSIPYGGTIGDSAPIVEAPQLSGWTYNIAAGSPVFNSPVDFPTIVGSWGPPGYVIPQTGTAPSGTA